MRRSAIVTAMSQRTTCVTHGADFLAAPDDLKVGLSRGAAAGSYPLNGLRHRPEPGTSGWFIWAGEAFSQDPDFFQPIHIAHLHSRLPEVIPYLGLAPGWRFLIAPGHIDVWLDPSLLAPVNGSASRP